MIGDTLMSFREKLTIGIMLLPQLFGRYDMREINVSFEQSLLPSMSLVAESLP